MIGINTISGNHSPKPFAPSPSSQVHRSKEQAVWDGFPNPSKSKGIVPMPSGRAAEANKANIRWLRQLFAGSQRLHSLTLAKSSLSHCRWARFFGVVSCPPSLTAEKAAKGTGALTRSAN